jgi:protein SCO1/2
VISRKWFWAFQAGFVVLLGAALFLRDRHPKQLPQFTEIPLFRLTDHNGSPFDSSQLKGKVWIASFIFTQCQGPCPIVTQAVSQIYRSYKIDERVQFVSISVDPENDTPEVLKSFAVKFEKNLMRWSFLTGPKKAIEELSMKGFRLGLEDDPMSHSTRVVLVDQSGTIRGYYDGTERESMKELFKDIARLLKSGGAA